MQPSEMGTAASRSDDNDAGACPKMVVAISSRALFDLDDEHEIFERDGLEAYRRIQSEREEIPLRPGTAYSLVKALQAVNAAAGRAAIEVVLVSRNDSDTGLRALDSLEPHGLKVHRAVFTDGRPAHDYLAAFSADLFLSANEADVRSACELGFAAALVYRPPVPLAAIETEVRIAFDGDAVLFSADAEQVYRQSGLEEFHRQERESAGVPMKPGPFKSFLEKLAAIQRQFPEERCPIRTALVTARSVPAHKRAIHTLRSWRVRLNESFFLGDMPKQPVLAAFRPHIFFDDRADHCDRAYATTPTARVPSG